MAVTVIDREEGVMTFTRGVNFVHDREGLTVRDSDGEVIAVYNSPAWQSARKSNTAAGDVIECTVPMVKNVINDENVDHIGKAIEIADEQLSVKCPGGYKVKTVRIDQDAVVEGIPLEHRDMVAIVVVAVTL